MTMTTMDTASDLRDDTTRMEKLGMDPVPESAGSKLPACCERFPLTHTCVNQRTQKPLILTCNETRNRPIRPPYGGHECLGAHIASTCKGPALLYYIAYSPNSMSRASPSSVSCPLRMVSALW
jgi:hypothetical protein